MSGNTAALPDGWMFLGDGWSATPTTDPDPNYSLALKCARGAYQRNLVRGVEALSGSTLRGKAKDWSSKYAASRAGLLERFKERGVAFSERTLDKRRVLVIGYWPGTEPPPPPPPPEPRFEGPVQSIDDLFN